MTSLFYMFPTCPIVSTPFEYDTKKQKEIYLKLKNLAIKFDKPSIFYRANPYKILNHCYKFPTYVKVYSAYAYNHTKYREIYLKLGAVARKLGDPSIFYRVNPYRVLEHCYCYDKQGKRKHLKDERHIYRLKTLHKIYEEIASYTQENQKIDGLKIDNIQYEADTYKYKLVRGDFKTFQGECFSFRNAELTGMELKPIKERLKAHVELLRQLRKGVEMQKAVKEVLFKYDSELTSKEMQLKIKIYKKLLANCKKLQEIASI